MLSKTVHRLTALSLLAAGMAYVSYSPAFGADHPTAVTESNPLGLPVTYIGILQDAPDSARIALVVEGDDVLAYICSADGPFNQDHSRWFRGTVKDGSIKLDVDGVTLQGKVHDDRIQGVLSKKDSHSFTARRSMDGSDGLFRAEDKIDDDTFVVGWIIDADRNVVGTGAKQKGKTVQTLQPPKPGQPLAAKVGTNPPVLANRVNGANPDVKTGGTLVSNADRNEAIQDAVATAKTMGGNPVQAILTHQMRRIMDKTPPATELEKKLQVALKKMPAEQMKKLVDTFDRLPKTTRESLLGTEGSALKSDQPLTSATSKKLLKQAASRMVPAKSPTPQAAATGTIKAMKINTLRCINDTLDVGRDEVFAIYLMNFGKDVIRKQTGIVKIKVEDDSKNFTAADALLFPSTGVTPAAGDELFIVACLMEDDGSGIAAVVNFLAPAIEAAVLLVAELGNGEKENLSPVEIILIKAAVKLSIDAFVKSATASELLTKHLGTDSITVFPDGKIKSDNGATRDKMTFTTQRRNGKIASHYELKGFVADIQP